MFADPIGIAARSPTPAIDFAVVKTGNYATERVALGDLGYTLNFSHQPGAGTNRHYCRVVQTKNAVDPYTSQTRKVNASVSLAIAASTFGFSLTDLSAMWALLKDVIDDTQVTFPLFVQNQS